MPMLPAMHDLSDETALRDLVQRLGDEMRDIAGGLHRLQALLGLILDESTLRGHSSLHEMQSLDLIHQRVESLSDFLAVLGYSIPAGWVVDTRDAGNLIRLSGLAARLAGQAEGDALISPTAGEFESF